MTYPISISLAKGGWLTNQLLDFARGGGEWILWILAALFVMVFVVFFERLFFYNSLKTSSEGIRRAVLDRLAEGDVDALLDKLKGDESMQARVIAYGLREAERGPEAVEQLCTGAIGAEKLRYEKRLSFLASVGSNAPFVGLFGTVLGVIMAFDSLRIGDAGQAGSTGPGDDVMNAIAEALVATGVGLLVAIPAIVFFNALKSRVMRNVTETRLLVRTMVAYMHDTQK